MRKAQLSSSIEIQLDSLTETELADIKEKCSGSNPAFKAYERLVRVKPGIAYSKKYTIPPETIELWEERIKTLRIPRGMRSFVESLGFQMEDNTVSVPTYFKSSITPRAYQLDAVAAVVAHSCGVLQARTGSGKTVMALMLVEELQEKTLFIVHTKALLNQTIAAIDKFLGEKAGVIGDGKYTIRNITVATIQTLIKKPPPHDTFGLVIFDECHHVPASTFIKVTNLFSAKYVYGLSATPQRPDGLSWALHASIGPLLHKVSDETLLKNKSVIKPKIIYVDTPYAPTIQYDPFDIASHLTDIANDKTRNAFIVNYIKDIFQQKPNIKPVILSERIAHTEYLAEVFKDMSPVLYHGQLGSKLQEERLKLITTTDGPFTISTYSSLAEGLDVPVWDTLFLVTPFASEIRAIQVIGRISRPAAGKSSCYVHDFIDVKDSVLFNRAEKRKRAYQSLDL